MRHQILGLLGLAGIALLGACGSSSDPSTAPPPAAAAGTTSSGAGAPGSSGSAGATSTAGATSAGASSAGTTSVAGAAGAQSAAGAAGAAGSTGSAGAGGGTAGAANFGGIVGLEDLSTVKPSPGCGTDIKAAYPNIAENKWQPVDNHNYKSGYTIDIPTPANHPVAAVAGKTLARRYFIKLPTGYDNTKPYKLIYEGAGCTGYGTDVPDYTTVSKGKAILVALEIYPGVWGGGATGGSPTGDPGVSCFDDKRGDLSIDKPLIEMLHPKLMSQLCVDEHRVFVSGHSSGGWLSEQYGNSYGTKIFRAIAPSSGALAQGAEQQTTNNMPVSGIWWHQTNDGTNPFSGTQAAIVHALVVNKCTNTNFNDTTQLVAAPFPSVTICQKFSSCPKEFPIILCREPGSDHRNAFDDPNQRAATWSVLDAY